MSRLPTAEDFLQDHLQISHFFNEKYEKMTCFQMMYNKQWLNLLSYT